MGACGNDAAGACGMTGAGVCRNDAACIADAHTVIPAKAGIHFLDSPNGVPSLPHRGGNRHLPLLSPFVLSVAKSKDALFLREIGASWRCLDSRFRGNDDVGRLRK